MPRPGEIVIFNRSHYEDVLIAKVRELASPQVIEARYALINRFAAGMVRQGTAIVKLFLHISAEEQQSRLLFLLGDPDKYCCETAQFQCHLRLAIYPNPRLDFRALKKQIKAVA